MFFGGTPAYSWCRRIELARRNAERRAFLKKHGYITPVLNQCAKEHGGRLPKEDVIKAEMEARLQRSQGESVMITVCDRCGQELSIGDFPFCPHGRGTAAPFRDDIPGGLRVENYGPEPVTFYSHTERRAYMKAHRLQEKEKFCPMPGTDIDPAGIPNPRGFLDAQTLANGIALITRQQKIQEFDAVQSGVLRNLTSEVVDDAEEVNRATYKG